MKLITELNENIEYVKEETEGLKRYYLRGVYAEAEVNNRNKRRYPFPILEREINRYTKENIEKNSGYGELGHPTGSNINLDRACLLIKELKQDKNSWIGKGLVTNTPMGRIVEGLIDDGARLGVSTRALGSLKPMGDGINEVQDDLRLLAVDVVADPSAPNAFVNGIMENVEYVYDAARGAYIEEHLDATKKALKGMSLRQIENAKLAIFEDFIAKLASR